MSGEDEHRSRRKAVIFVLLTFGINWSFALAYYWAGGDWQAPISLALAIPYMFVPAGVAVFVQRMFGEPVLEPLGIRFRMNRWYLFAWLMPPVASIASAGVALLLPGIEYSHSVAGLFERVRPLFSPEQFREAVELFDRLPFHPFWLALILGLVIGPTAAALAALGEEIGWRGLLERETRAIGFWKQSVLVGAVWGLWHAPKILQGKNYPQHPLFSVVMMTVWSILMTPFYLYVRRKAGSVVAAAVMHGSSNATTILSVFFLRGGDDLITAVSGLSGFIVLAGLNIGLAVLRRTSAEP